MLRRGNMHLGDKKSLTLDGDRLYGTDYDGASRMEATRTRW